MNRYVADTMALILRLEKRKMPQRAKEKFEEGERGKAEIIIPSMVFAELAYLSEKGKIDTNLKQTEQYLGKYPLIKEHFLSFEIIKTAFVIDDIPELHDGLIAANAKDLNCEIITNDPHIQQSKYISTVWE